MLIIIAIFIAILIFIFKNLNYNKSKYKEQTHNSYFSLIFDKGKLGEYYLYEELEMLPGYKHYLFNCYVPTQNGTTEIDVILLHETGVYVFESKNYSGWIFGNENQQYWTQVLPVGKGRSQKHQFFNPIIQNKIHIRKLKTFLKNTTNIPFYSYIIFSNRCELKDITISSNSNYVINRYSLLYSLKEVISKTNITLSKETIDELYDKLYPLTQTDNIKKLAHVIHIQEQKNSTICPLCGAKLVVRTVKRGNNIGKKFMGCPNYPNCRFTRNI